MSLKHNFIKREDWIWLVNPCALGAAIISGILGVYVFNIWIFRGFGSLILNWNKQKIWGILKDCFPIFIGMFLWIYLLSASRIVVDDAIESEYQSYYQVLFMPVSVINLFARFLIRPSLISDSNSYLCFLYYKKEHGIGRMKGLGARITCCW